MSPATGKNSANLNKLTKAALIDLVQQSRAELSEKTAEIERCRGKLEQVDADDKLIENLENKLNEMNQANAQTERSLSEVIREKETLRKQVRHLEKSLKEGEEREKVLRQEIEAVEQSSQSEAGPETVYQKEKDSGPENLSSAKATFRIDLYDRQGQLHGKIVHLLSRDQVNFRDIDSAAIINFLSNHLPKNGIEVNQSVPSSEQQVSSTIPASTHASKPVQESTETATIVLKSEPEAYSTRNFVHSDQIFRIHLGTELKEVHGELNFPLHYQASLFTKSLSGKNTKIATVEDFLLSAEQIEIEIEPNQLEPGLYYLEAIINFRNERGAPAPVAVFEEKGLIQVL